MECLIDIQIHVLPKFIKGLLASQARSRKKNPVDNQDENKAEETEETGLDFFIISSISFFITVICITTAIVQ